MKSIEPKSKIVEKIADRYNLKHGDMVEVEWLREIANREKIDMHDFRSIFGVPNRKNNDENDTSEKVMIKLYETKELEKMENDILKTVQKLKRMTQASLEEICNKFKINIWILTGIIQKRLGNKSMEKGQKKAKVLKSKKEEYERLLEEAKYTDYVTKEIIMDWKKKYKLEDKEICAILDVNMTSYRNLMNSKTKKMRIDLIDDEEKKQIKGKIIERFNGQDYVSKNDIDELKKEVKTTDNLIKTTLSIPSMFFEQIMADETKKARIIIKELKKKLKILKLDMKYIYGERNYTRDELKNICKFYGVKSKDYLRNLSRNVKRYRYVKQALRKNKDGIFIGKEHPISHKFAEENGEKIENLCKKLTQKYFYYPYLKNDEEDMIQDACLLILEKGGSLEKNFSYNQDLLFNLLSNKVKYYIMSKRHREFPEILWENIERVQENILPYEVWDDDIMLELMEAKDERIKIIHQKVMQILYYNKDFVYYYREKAYQIIAYKLNIPIEHLENVIKEIGELMLEYKLAKLCRDGRVINMAEAY